MEEHGGLQPLTTSQRAELEEATTSYESALMASGDVMEYLAGRGIDLPDVDTFRLGVVHDPFPGHGRYRGMLAIPYLDRDGAPLTIRFRCLAQHNCRELAHGKYMTMPDDPVRMFNVRAVHEAGDEIHVTEGEFDAMVLCKLDMHAVAIPGANAWKGHHRRMLAGFSRVYCWGDPDDAGAEFNRKVTRALRSARAVRLKAGDVTDTYLQGGAEALLSLVREERV